MMKKAAVFLTALLIASCSSMPELEFPITGDKYLIGDPSPGETYVLELINRARSDPHSEGLFLIHTGDASVDSAISYFANNNSSTFAITTNQIRIAFDALVEAPPLAFNRYLNDAAAMTTRMLIQYDVQDHNVGGMTPWERMEASGYTGYSSAGENIYSYSDGILYGHAGFNIDWGNGPYGLQDPPGHRLNIMETNHGYREIGISAVSNADTSKTVGPIVMSEEFAYKAGTQYFVTGVVYDDKNANRFYDMGEGIGGIYVSLENNSYYAVTSDSGAYTIPFTSGMGVVRAQAGGGNFATQVVSVTLAAANYKLDFNVQGTGANGDASVGFTAASIIILQSERQSTDRFYAPLGWRY